ncbi:hypothetical protein GpartN1_g7158.t1 [Galdieria partita]|uniref:Cyclin-dependent kinase inhibitor domain-containing protein n=1 Tax=Galdieria partita TaxID=83374 RepID=A0A9C7UU73_9RHOD|nr:hypothetical protein GpartN1_g7158.t1 [Galdieria partita]
MSHTSCKSSQESSSADFHHCCVKDTSEESVNYHKQPENSIKNSSRGINKRKKNYSERIHNLWLRRVRRLLFPEGEEYRKSLLYQVPLRDEEEDQKSYHEELLQLWSQIQEKKVQRFRARWNFDPVTETPLEGRWKWTKLSE